MDGHSLTTKHSLVPANVNKGIKKGTVNQELHDHAVFFSFSQSKPALHFLPVVKMLCAELVQGRNRVLKNTVTSIPELMNHLPAAPAS